MSLCAKCLDSKCIIYAIFKRKAGIKPAASVKDHAQAVQPPWFVQSVHSRFEHGQDLLLPLTLMVNPELKVARTAAG